MTDKYDKQSKELLPCSCSLTSTEPAYHLAMCAGSRRPVVVDALRELGAEIERQKIIIEKLLHGNEELREALADPPPAAQAKESEG